MSQFSGAVTRLEHEAQSQIPRGRDDYQSQIFIQKESGNYFLRITPTLAEQLDSWEVDPVWDERSFLSATQAVRPNRKGKIPTTLNLTVVGKTVRIRLVKISGELVELTLNI